LRPAWATWQDPERFCRKPTTAWLGVTVTRLWQSHNLAQKPLQLHAKMLHQGLLPSDCLFNLGLVPPTFLGLVAKDYCFKISLVILLNSPLKTSSCLCSLNLLIAYYGIYISCRVLVSSQLSFIHLQRMSLSLSLPLWYWGLNSGLHIC
jgi:hypothetical protein